MKEIYESRSPDRARDPEKSFEYLNSLLHKVSADISRELEEKYDVKRLINSDCSIRMDAFHSLNPEQVRADWDFVNDRERDWSGVKDADKRSALIKRYGLDEKSTDAQIIKRQMEEKTKDKSKQLEMVVTILLHKAFGDKYMVVRSSKYDDYAGGVDNVIVNKETGAVICAVDDVRQNEKSDRRIEKDEEVLDKTRNGGAKLAYGFTFRNGKIDLVTLKNLPIFCLGLDEEEYEQIVNAIEYDDNSSLNDTEQRILSKIMSSIKEQKMKLLSDAMVQNHAGLISNLNGVDELFK